MKNQITCIKRILITIVSLSIIIVSCLIQSCSTGANSNVFFVEPGIEKRIIFDEVAILPSIKPFAIEERNEFEKFTWIVISNFLRTNKIFSVEWGKTISACNKINYLFNNSENNYEKIADLLNCNYLIIPEYQLSSGTVINPIFSSNKYYSSVQLKIYSKNSNRIIAILRSCGYQYTSQGLFTLTGGVASYLFFSNVHYYPLIIGGLFDLFANVSGRQTRWETATEEALEDVLFDFLKEINHKSLKK